jgi:VWFA-related protein
MKMNGKWFALAALSAALLTVGADAQGPAKGQGQAPITQNHPQVVPQDRAPVYRTGVELVTTDVIPRDRRGQFVADLKPQEFQLLEDGVKQNVIQVLMFHGGRQYGALTAPTPAVREGIILPAARPATDAAGRIFVFFLDDLHLDFRDTGRLRDLMKKIKRELVHEGDMFCVVSSGPSSIEIDMTYNLKRLDDAMNKLSGSGLRPSDIVEGGETTEGPSEVRYRAHVAFSTVFDVLTQLESVHNRRKSLIYISNGYDFNPFPKGRYQAEQERMGRTGGSNSNDSSSGGTPSGNDTTTDDSEMFSRQGQQFAQADLARELSELIRAANRSNVSMYTLDPRGLVGTPDLDQTVDIAEWQDYIRNSQDSLRVLADETGGYAVVNQNDFDKALKRIDAETSDYYVLGYYSSNPDPFRRNRKIEVKVTRQDVNVWARKGYSLKSKKARKEGR